MPWGILISTAPNHKGKLESAGQYRSAWWAKGVIVYSWGYHLWRRNLKPNHFTTPSMILFFVSSLEFFAFPHSDYIFSTQCVIMASFVVYKDWKTTEAVLVTLVFSLSVSVFGKHQVLYRYLLNKWMKSQYLIVPLRHFVPRFESSNFRYICK